MHWIANTSVISRSVPKNAFPCSPVAQAQNFWHRLKVTPFPSEAFCWNWVPWMTQCHDRWPIIWLLWKQTFLWVAIRSTESGATCWRHHSQSKCSRVLERHCVSVTGSSCQHLFDLNQLCHIQDSGAKKMMLQSCPVIWVADLRQTGSYSNWNL